MTPIISEDMLEREVLGWLEEVGYVTTIGIALGPDSGELERSSYAQVTLSERLRTAIKKLNPHLPVEARNDALFQVLNLDIPAMLPANRHFHKLLVYGVPVSYQQDGMERGDFARLIDFENPGSND